MGPTPGISHRSPLTANQCVVVDHDVDHGARPGWTRTIGPQEIDQGVDTVRLSALEPAAADGFRHDVIGAVIDPRHHPGQLAGCHLRLQMADPSADPAPDMAMLVDPTMAFLFIDQRRRFHPLTLVPQAPQRQLPRCLHKLRLGLGHLGDHISDLPSLDFRQQPIPEGGRQHRQIPEELRHLQRGHRRTNRRTRLRSHPRRHRAVSLPAPHRLVLQRGGHHNPQRGQQPLRFGALLYHPNSFGHIEPVDVDPTRNRADQPQQLTQRTIDPSRHTPILTTGCDSYPVPERARMGETPR